MAAVSEIHLSPARAALLHKLAAGEELLREAAHRFSVGRPHRPRVTTPSNIAEVLIDHRLVDNHGPLTEGNMYSPTRWLINDKGRAWCEANPLPETSPETIQPGGQAGTS